MFGVRVCGTGKLPKHPMTRIDRVPHVSPLLGNVGELDKTHISKPGQMWGSLGYLAIPPSARSAAVTRPQRVPRLRYL
jgi:hypothetical protein